MTTRQSPAAHRLTSMFSPKRFRGGGHVRGPGSSTSDSIPARLSDGEFVLPADTVRKVGVKKLQDLVSATHKPSGNAPKSGRFADGGVVDEEKKKPNSFGDAAAVASDSAVRPISPTNIWPQGSPSAGRSPYVQDAASAPAPATTGADPAQIPTGGLKAPAPDGSQDRWTNTEVGRNLTNLATALPGSTGNLVQGVVRTGGAISTGLEAARQALGGTLAGMALGSVAAKAAANQAGPTPAVGAGRGVVNPPAVDPSKPLESPVAPAAASLTEPPSLTSNVTRSGNSYSGSNIGGDITINGAAPRNGGMVSAANLSIADRLSSNQAPAPAAPVGPVQAAGLQAPVVRHSGNDWQMRNDLRNAQVSASSITNNGGRWDQHKGVSPERAYAAALEQADTKARFAQPGVDLATQRENASLQREGMQQQGATNRTVINAATDGERNQISRGKLALEQMAAGFQNRSAQRTENAQLALENAKTPEEARSARERLLALAGKAPQNEWKLHVTPTTRNLDGSTTEGSVFRLNQTTGETQRVDTGSGRQGAPLPPKDKLVKGQVYQTPRGPAHWDGKQFTPA